MRKTINDFFVKLAKIAGQYAIITGVFSGIFYGIWWAVSPRVESETAELITELIAPKLKERDEILLEAHEEMIYSAFVNALTDTIFLNKINDAVKLAAEEVVDEKLKSVVRREMKLELKEMVKDTVWIINPMTGDQIGYDVYHFFNGAVIKLDEKRY